MNKQANWRNLFTKKKNNELSQFIDSEVLPISREIAALLGNLQKHKQFADLFNTVKEVYYGVQTLRQQLNQKTATASGSDTQGTMLAGRLEELMGDLSGTVQQMMQMTDDPNALKSIYGLNMKIKNTLDFLKNYSSHVQQQQQQQMQQRNVSQQPQQQGNELSLIPPVFHKHLKRLPGYQSAGLVVDVQGLRAELDNWLSNYGAQAKDDTGDYRGRYIQLEDFKMLMQGKQPARPDMKLRSRKGDPSEERRVTPDNEPDEMRSQRAASSLSDEQRSQLKILFGF